MNNKKTNNTGSNVGLLLLWPLVSSTLLLLPLLLVAIFLSQFERELLLGYIAVGTLIIIGHIFAFYYSYKIVNFSISKTVSIAVFHTAMIGTIILQAMWRLMAQANARISCSNNCDPSVLPLHIDILVTFFTVCMLIASGIYLHLKLFFK